MIRLTGDKHHEAALFLLWLQTVTDIRHEVVIELTANQIHGICYVPDSPPTPYILAVIDGGLIDTLAHEMVHYEQWRDGRELTERGVKKRAAALVNRWRRER